ncbi:MAG: HDOD domain-containing protein [Phycisphaerales bacterium]
MDGSTTTPNETPRADRVEIILQRLEGLPTLSSVATRVLELTSDDDADVRDLVGMIESDPSMTTKILSMCRRADRGVRGDALTLNRAVVLLGFDAIRNAVLSVEIFGLFPPAADAGESMEVTPLSPDSQPRLRFDRAAFWKHCIATAVACELLAGRLRQVDGFDPSEAFTCGLLHDLGKLALSHLLPKSYERVVELTEMQVGDIAEMERRVIGVDHHTVGKRLAERWSLPHVLQDVMWLHGQPFESLPDLPHQRMIALVTLADAVVRSQHIGFSGTRKSPRDLAPLASRVGLAATDIEAILETLFAETQRRSQELGLDEAPSIDLLLSSIAGANRSLGQINSALERRSRQARRQERVLRAISEFHKRDDRAQSVVSTAGHVVASAAREFGRGFFAMLCPTTAQDEWQILQFQGDGRLTRSQIVDPKITDAELEDLADDLQVSVGAMALLPWLTEYVGDASDVRRVRLLPLRYNSRLVSILLHDRCFTDLDLTRTELMALCETWSAAIAAASQHEGARRLGEQLAESNRVLTETQAKLARTQAMASLGEMAAGAAHEMNNPLCVISGRSQVLAHRLEDTDDRRMAQQIAEQAHRLSDLITSLHLFGEPPAPKRRSVELKALVDRAIESARARRGTDIPIEVDSDADDALGWVDGEQVAQALTELIVNAIEAEPETIIRVRIETMREDGRLSISVKDDGRGMSDRTLEHAFDPFFSEKAAGRQAGLGLARAQRFVAAHGGEISLESAPGEGTVATIRLAHDSLANGTAEDGVATKSIA